MKKFVSLMIALALCLSMFALAESVPSKTVSDLEETAIAGEGIPEGAAIAVSTDAALVAACNAEIAKLAASDPATYFGQPAALAAILGEGANVTVNEFMPLDVSGFTGIEEGKSVVATFKFATPYAAGSKVAVMIGITKIDANGNEVIEWIAFEGTVNADGSVSAEFDSATLLAMQGGAMLAVASAA